METLLAPVAAALVFGALYLTLHRRTAPAAVPWAWLLAIVLAAAVAAAIASGTGG